MKKAMELPTNFIVLMILGLLMFGAASFIAYKVFFAADTMHKELAAQTEKQIQAALMKSNGKVLVGSVSKDIKRGSNDVFGIGIRNVEPESHTFYLSGSCKMVITKPDDKVFCDNSDSTKSACTGFCDKWLKTGGTAGGGSVTLEPKTSKVMPVYISVPSTADNGDYWFEVTVCIDKPCVQAGKVYETAKMLAVRVG